MRTYKDCDPYKFMESLKYRPETYRTILLDKFNNKNTETNKVRKKISSFVRQGLIASGLLDGESGTKVFYTLDKHYFIFIVRDITGYHHYYCSDVEEISDEEIVMFNAFILSDYDWEYVGNIGILKSIIMRWF